MTRLYRNCLTLIFAACALVCLPSASAQVAGQNVNMVWGTKWPGGDPFLQRQNEPSMAVSTRNPMHILAGAKRSAPSSLPATTTSTITKIPTRFATLILGWSPAEINRSSSTSPPLQ